MFGWREGNYQEIDGTKWEVVEKHFDILCYSLFIDDEK